MEQGLLVVGFLTTTILGWVLQRTLKLPGRVAKLEQALINHENLIEERYVRKLGTVDNPGFTALQRRVLALEIKSEQPE